MSDVNKSPISLTKNERMSEWLIFLSKSPIGSFLEKTSNSLGNQMSEFPALVGANERVSVPKRIVLILVRIEHESVQY